jgi:hypothetical protein
MANSHLSATINRYPEEFIAPFDEYPPLFAGFRIIDFMHFMPAL